MKRLWPAAILALPLAVACTSAKEKARADSAQALAGQQRVLMAKLEAQKDSLSLVVGDADSFIAKVDSTHSVRMVSAVGRRLPAHCTGVGKALLSGLSPDALDARCPRDRARGGSDGDASQRRGTFRGAR